MKDAVVPFSDKKTKAEIELCASCLYRLKLDCDFSLPRPEYVPPMYISMCADCGKIFCTHLGTWLGFPSRWLCEACFGKLEPLSLLPVKQAELDAEVAKREAEDRAYLFKF